MPPVLFCPPPQMRQLLGVKLGHRGCHSCYKTSPYISFWRSHSSFGWDVTYGCSHSTHCWRFTPSVDLSAPLPPHKVVSPPTYYSILESPLFAGARCWWQLRCVRLSRSELNAFNVAACTQIRGRSSCWKSCPKKNVTFKCVSQHIPQPGSEGPVPPTRALWPKCCLL